MVGLNGVVVKSHGGTDAEAFAHAVDVAMDMVVHRFNDQIRQDLARSGLDKPAAPDKNGKRRGWHAHIATPAAAPLIPDRTGC